MSNKSKTITQEVFFEGIGVHSGLPSKVVLRPSQPNSGIIIKNAHMPDDHMEVGKVIPNVAMYATILSKGEWKISTLEHLMAAVVGLGIDNIVIEVDGSELPIMDGSALPFVQEILSVGFEEQEEDKRFLTPKKILVFEDYEKGRFLEITPADTKKDGNENRELHIDYQADFDHPMVGSGEIDCCFSEDFFVKEIAPARTFGFLEQLPFMRKNGLAKGASLENTVVISENGYLNERRFEDEFVRHKLLDMLGDLALLGKRITGKIVAKRTGHNFNRLVVEHYIKNPDEWKII